MKLYRSLQNKEEFIGECKTPEELGELMLKDARTKFVSLSGTFDLNDMKPGLIYAERHPGGLRYELREE